MRQTVLLLRRRGYAVGPARLAEICLGGPLSESEVRWAVAACRDLVISDELVVDTSSLSRITDIRGRARAHHAEASAYMQMTRAFVRILVGVAPFIRSVSIAGSLASGGFRQSDDVDLNLIVDDGYRHLAYVVVNFLGLVHALRHRAKPVDDLTRRPLAPRLMTANLILERSQCIALQRQDEDMAFELLISEPVFGVETIHQVIESNPGLLEQFPQLAGKAAPLLIRSPAWRLPRAAFPKVADGAARTLGATAWRYMQWTRRHKPDALARVAYVRATMRPYALFDE
ncbi:MAG: hypothetical protein E6J53_03760 [Chloroflexi bacterium]|nr:MAG: hypothetical protein E6J53_03760 [Chloroflexota bacterium]